MLHSLSSQVQAKVQAKTIIVPDDYSSIQTAIDSAKDGDTVFLRKGTYEGLLNQTLIINNTIALVGEDPFQTILNLHPRYVITGSPPLYYEYYEYPLSILANNVRISGLTIRSDGGTAHVSGNHVELSRNNLHLNTEFYGSNETFCRNIVYSSITVKGSYSRLFLNSLFNCSISAQVGSFNCIFANRAVGGGFGCEDVSSKNLIYNNTVIDGSYIVALHENTVVGNTVTGSYCGIYIPWGFDNVIYGNNFSNNQIGLYKKEGDNNTFYGNFVAENQYGAFILGDRGNSLLFQNNFVNNHNQVDISKSEVHGVPPSTFTTTRNQAGNFDNGTVGNFWTDYTGADDNGDGIGDSEYVIDQNRRDSYPLISPFDIKSIANKLPAWVNVSDIEISSSGNFLSDSEILNQPTTSFLTFSDVIPLGTAVLLTEVVVAVSASSIVHFKGHRKHELTEPNLT